MFFKDKNRLEYNEDFLKMKVELASVQERKAQGDNEVYFIFIFII